MVFLGGAVLANIVSRKIEFESHLFPDTDNPIDGRQGEHVDQQAGVARAWAEDTREAWPEVVQESLGWNVANL